MPGCRCRSRRCRWTSTSSLRPGCATMMPATARQLLARARPQRVTRRVEQHVRHVDDQPARRFARFQDDVQLLLKFRAEFGLLAFGLLAIVQPIALGLFRRGGALPRRADRPRGGQLRRPRVPARAAASRPALPRWRVRSAARAASASVRSRSAASRSRVEPLRHGFGFGAPRIHRDAFGVRLLREAVPPLARARPRPLHCAAARCARVRCVLPPDAATRSGGCLQRSAPLRAPTSRRCGVPCLCPALPRLARAAPRRAARVSPA